MPGHMFILTGLSGAGKTTISYELLKRRPNLRKVVTTTTRPPRENEKEGVDYYFTDTDTFRKMIEKDEFFEWDAHYGVLYGSQKKHVHSLLESGNDVLFQIDPTGTMTIKRAYPNAISMFLHVPKEILLKRWEKRRGATGNKQERIDAIESEIEIGNRCDYLIENTEGKLEETIHQIMAIMDQA